MFAALRSSLPLPAMVRAEAPLPLSPMAAATVTLPGPVNTSSRQLPAVRLPPVTVAIPEPTFMMPFRLSEFVPETVIVPAAP